MSTLYIVIIVFFLILFILRNQIKKFLLKPYKHKDDQSRIHHYLSVLKKRGFDAGILWIDLPGTKLFLQFQKHIDLNEQYITLDFPLTTWSEKYYPSIKELMLKSGISIEIVKEEDDELLKGKAEEFMLASFDDNMLLAARTTQIIINEIFNYDKSKILHFSFDNINPADEQV